MHRLIISPIRATASSITKSELRISSILHLLYRADTLTRMAARKVVDIHTHVYPPRYLSILRSRTTLPRIVPGVQTTEPERLIILPDEDKSQSTSSGRPVGPDYYDINVKLSFMKRHSIDISVIRFTLPIIFG